MKNGETCVIELSSLAAPNMGAAGNHLLFLEKRIKEIRQRILDHKPTVVVMYGKEHKPHWEAIVGSPFGPDDLLTIGSTTAAFAFHPVSVGVRNDYWFQLALTLRTKIGEGGRSSSQFPSPRAGRVPSAQAQKSTAAQPN